MFGYLILLFTVVPIVELALLIKVGQRIGLGNTLLIVIFTAVAGAYLAKSQGLIILKRMQEDVNNGIMPTDKLFDGFLVLCGGVLLITPGLITDAIGFIMLIPFTRRLIKIWIKRKVKDMILKGRIITIYGRGWRSL